MGIIKETNPALLENNEARVGQRVFFSGWVMSTVGNNYSQD